MGRKYIGWDYSLVSFNLFYQFYESNGPNVGPFTKRLRLSGEYDKDLESYLTSEGEDFYQVNTHMLRNAYQ